MPVRQREEVQEMLRRVITAICFAALTASAAILPDHLGPDARTADQTATFPANKAITDEYGLAAAEQASYGRYSITAYQFRDPTGAFAASKLVQGAILDGNYLLQCKGRCPAEQQLTALLANLPKLYRGPYPMLPDWMPAGGMVAGTDRYILGPASLASFAPRIPASVAGFQFSAEAEVAQYRRNRAQETLALLSYPSPSIARQQVKELANVAGATVQRDGPLVAVVFDAPDLNSARELLAGLRYRASVTQNEPMPLQLSPQSAAKMVLSIFELAGILLLFCLFSGLLFGFGRVVSRRLGSQNGDEPMVLLHLTDK